MRKQLLTALVYFLPFIITAQSFVGKGKAVDPFNYTIHKDQEFRKGSVVSAHPISSMVGAEILKRGGNAVDAAIATQLALAVVFPVAGNIGGGGFMVARINNKNISLDYREMAPAAAHKDMYLNSSGDAQLNLSQNGHLASGVPGTVAGLFASHKYAKLPFKTLIQPAIDIAENGFRLTRRDASSLNGSQAGFIEHNTQKTVFINSAKWKEGDILVQKELANTLKRIRDKGQAGFYEGETARLIVAEMKRGNGIITLADLRKYKAKERKPLTFSYKGHTVVSMPPPSSGGVLLWQMMKMVEKRPLAQYGFHSTKSVQLMIEAERRAFADRAEHLGDPDYWKVPVASITSQKYVQERMKDYDSTKATPSSSIKAGMAYESDQTTHLSIVDQWGNMVAVTTTLNGGFGSKTVVGGAGFLLNNEMDDFSIKPGVPNMFGAVGGEANKIEPGKRMLSSMTPTIVLKNNKPYIVAGTPGGTTIITSVFQTLINIIDYRMNASDAVNKPKFHHQWLPDVVDVEKTLPENVKNDLLRMGYKLNERNGIGRTEVIKVVNGKLQSAADKRGDDSVAGH
ncbi:MAG TPA: gamma-glutamyltransferase [Segetibacter sp.]